MQSLLPGTPVPSPDPLDGPPLRPGCSRNTNVSPIYLPGSCSPIHHQVRFDQARKKVLTPSPTRDTLLEVGAAKPVLSTASLGRRGGAAAARSPQIPIAENGWIDRSSWTQRKEEKLQLQTSAFLESVSPNSSIFPRSSPA